MVAGDSIYTGYVHTYYVCMNVTLAIPDALVEKARALAKKRGTSLNQMIRDHLEREVGGEMTAGQRAAARLEELWAQGPLGRSDGTGYGTRDEIYEERIK